LHSSVSALRGKHDIPSSDNGQNMPVACADGEPTPFAAALTGLLQPKSTCQDYHGVYPNYIQTLSAADGSFTLTVTPFIWGNGNPSQRQTILHLEFASTNPNISLASFVMAGLVPPSSAASSNPGPGYVACGQNSNGGLYSLTVTTNDTTAKPATTVSGCTQASMTFTDGSGVLEAIEPTPIQFADTNTTRWDIDGLTGSTVPPSPLPAVDLIVGGYPNDLLTGGVDVDGGPATPANNLTQSFMTNANNFLAVAIENNNGTLIRHTAGSLSIPNVTTAPTNDNISNAIIVSPASATQSGGFTTQLNSSTATPGQDSAGNLTDAPTDPNDPLLPSTCIPTGYTDGAVFRTVWFSFSPTASGTGSISTANSRYDTVMALFTGTPGNLTLQACDDDFVDSSGATEPQAELAGVQFSAGTTYYVMVGESPTDTGIQNNSKGSPNGVTVAAPLSNDATLFFSLAETVTSTPPTATLAPAKLAFAAEAIGKMSAAKKVTLTNTSTNGATLNVPTLFFTGADPTDFAISNNGCTANLAPGGKCTISVTFSPEGIGGRAATLNVMDNATNSPQTAALTGTGPNFSISISPTTATVTQGQSLTATVTLTPINGFNQTITVTCAAPHGSTCSAAPVTLDGVDPASTTLTITTTTKTPQGTYNTNVFGTSGTDKHSTRIVVTVD
jgi:Abnormal spindle-like microcephaly-assoc'd, ASPM-SPD-2-Hydin